MSANAQKLMSTMTATKVSFHWWGLTRKVTTTAKQQMACAVGMNADTLSASKKIADPKHPAIKRLTTLAGRIDKYWKSQTLPYVEDGVRLLPTHKTGSFHQQMEEYRAEIKEAAADLQTRREEIVAAAELQLGNEFNPAHYPDDLSALFDLSWSYPPTEPPVWLPPEVRDEEVKRVIAEFEMSVKLGEQALAQHLADCTAHLADAMTSGPDGKPRVFRDSAVNNLLAAIERFKDLSIGSNAELEKVVAELQGLVKNVTPNGLRKNFFARQEIKKGMEAIGSKLETLLVTKPRRKVIAAPVGPALPVTEGAVACA